MIAKILLHFTNTEFSLNIFQQVLQVVFHDYSPLSLCFFLSPSFFPVIIFTHQLFIEYLLDVRH